MKTKENIYPKINFREVNKHMNIKDILELINENIDEQLQSDIEDKYEQTISCNCHRYNLYDCELQRDDKDRDDSFNVRRAECYVGNRFQPGIIYCFCGNFSGSLCEKCVQRDCCNKSKHNKGASMLGKNIVEEIRRMNKHD